MGGVRIDFAWTDGRTEEEEKVHLGIGANFPFLFLLLSILVGILEKEAHPPSSPSSFLLPPSSFRAAAGIRNEKEEEGNGEFASEIELRELQKMNRQY